jgi:predicted Mrr-cat superfamily restriction endonuclease
LNCWCVRADFGKFTEDFIKGGYAAIGFIYGINLTGYSQEELKVLYEQANPGSKPLSAAQNVGQVLRFINDIKLDDYIITPGQDSSKLYYGKVESDYYFEDPPSDNCRFPHRKKVKWEKEPLIRSQLPMPIQYTLRSTLTVYAVKQVQGFLEAIGKEKIIPNKKPEYAKDILEVILSLSADEFEEFLTSILQCIGFEAKKIGAPGDDGVDVEGELDVYGLARVDLKVQAKRYRLGARISPKEIKKFRGSIPEKSQGAFITTADYQKAAYEEAMKEGFKKIGLINGSQLVDILIDNYDDLPQELKDKLGFRKILVPLTE